MLKKTLKAWNKIKHLIKLKSNDVNEYNDKYKIKFNSDHDLALAKTLQLHDVVIVARFVFNDNNKQIGWMCKLTK